MKACLRRLPTQQGFSLLEMMIAVVIGMFSVLVIMQVMSGTATSRRIAVGGGDAQLNGVSAIRALQLDLEQAGLGLQSFNILGCGLSYLLPSGSAVNLTALAPVMVNPPVALVPAGDANTDTLLVISGNSGSPSEGDLMTAATSAGAYIVTTPDSFQPNDKVIAAPSTRATNCSLQAAAVSTVSGSTLNLAGGTAGLPNGSIAYNLGGAPTVRAYAIRNGDLTVCDYLATNCGSTGSTTPVDPLVWAPVASNIVSLRVQYARDTSGITGGTSVMDGVVDTYDQTTPGDGSNADNAAAIPVFCKWARVVGLRLAVVARGQQYDKTLSYVGGPNLTALQGSTTIVNKTVLPALTWTGAAGAPITLAGTDWDRYRYAVVQTALPLRNMIWQGSQPAYQGGAGGC